MLNLIGVKDFPLEEAYPYTFDENNYWNTNTESVQLDYIFLQARETSTKIIRQHISRPTHAYKGVQIDLADHYGIIADIEVINQ